MMNKTTQEVSKTRQLFLFTLPSPPPSLSLSLSLSLTGGVAANKSMIMYMLGQVRVGMDLTRITLPTFILEKRSLLEMYADFLAHPDLLVKLVSSRSPFKLSFLQYY